MTDLPTPLAINPSRSIVMGIAKRWVVVAFIVACLPRPARSEELNRKPELSRDSQTETDRITALESRLRADMAYLASDELAGRDTGSEGLELAAKYIAQSFADAGLKTDLFEGKSFQTFKIPMGVTLGDEAKNSLTILGRTDALTSASEKPVEAVDETTDKPDNRSRITGNLGKTFQPLGLGATAKVQGPVVFAGYGITAPELAYDDYASVKARGAVVIILRKEPQGTEADKRFDGVRNTRHAYFESKIRNAADQGAIGVLLVNDPVSIAQSVQAIDRRIASETGSISEIQKQLSLLPAEAENIRKRQEARIGEINSMIDDLKRQREIASEGLMNIGDAGEKTIVDGLPVASISWSLASGLLESASGQTLDAVKRAIDDSVSPRSIDLKADGELQTALSPAEVATSNVLGLLPGRGTLAGETIVVGAHYDHVGMGGPGSLAPGTIAIHNGADDNASGASVLLSSVHRIAELLDGAENHRQVLFIAFTAEERGLLGSEHYVNYPRFPLEKTVAMINLDMVGRLRNNDLTVYGIGTSSQFDPLVERANQKTGFQLFKVTSGYGPSDHQSFYTRKIPVLFFFTGLHSDYHRPSDKIDKINFNGMARITDITSAVVSELAIVAQRPDYATTDRDVKIRQQRQVFLGVSLQEAFDRDGEKAEPDAEGDQPAGATVSAVSVGSPAETAGVRPNDRLMKINGISIRSLSDVIEMVGQREENDQLIIELQRGTEKITTSATLKLRPEQ
ncbi:MAG TPA: peptidase M28 [Planctomycetaceae bacterium]|nr:peptidase M28 [Planctomycetaceae bacterium]